MRWSRGESRAGKKRLQTPAHGTLVANKPGHRAVDNEKQQCNKMRSLTCCSTSHEPLSLLLSSTGNGRSFNASRSASQLTSPPPRLPPTEALLSCQYSTHAAVNNVRSQRYVVHNVTTFTHHKNNTKRHTQKHTTKNHLLHGPVTRNLKTPPILTRRQLSSSCARTPLTTKLGRKWPVVTCT